MEKFKFKTVPDNVHLVSSSEMLIDVVELCHESLDSGIEYYISLDTEKVYKHDKNTDYAVIMNPCKNGKYRLNDYGSVYRYYSKEQLLDAGKKYFDLTCEINKENERNYYND